MNHEGSNQFLKVPQGLLSATMSYFSISGIFFIIPCIESYTKVDLRTVSFDVPPQEVGTNVVLRAIPNWISGPSLLMCHHKR